jgi:hypothetical protein
VNERPRNHAEHVKEFPGICRWTLADHCRRGLLRDRRLREPRTPDGADDIAADRGGGGLGEIEMDDIENVEEKIDGKPAAPAGDSEPAARRSNRHVMREAGVQADLEGTDWANWSMCRAVRLLNSNNDMNIRRTLMKIHIKP